MLPDIDYSGDLSLGWAVLIRAITSQAWRAARRQSDGAMRVLFFGNLNEIKQGCARMKGSLDEWRNKHIELKSGLQW